MATHTKQARTLPWSLKQISRHPWLVSLAASVCIGAMVLWGSNEVDPGKDEIYLTAMRDILPGEGVELNDFTLGPNPLAEGSADDLVSEDQIHQIESSVFQRPLKKGGVLRRSLLSVQGSRKRKIPFGSRAYLIHPEPWLNVGPGDHVEVLGQTDSTDAIHVVAGPAEVLGVTSDAEARGVVLALRPDEISWVEKASRRGTLKMAVQSAAEAKRAPRRKHSLGSRRHRPSADVVVEGE